MAANDNLWKHIAKGYERLLTWITATAPQLKDNNHWMLAFVNTISRKHRNRVSFNCGF